MLTVFAEQLPLSPLEYGAGAAKATATVKPPYWPPPQIQCRSGSPARPIPQISKWEFEPPMNQVVRLAARCSEIFHLLYFYTE